MMGSIAILGVTVEENGRPKCHFFPDVSPQGTWCVCVVSGFVIYFGYGISHSAEAVSPAARERSPGGPPHTASEKKEFLDNRPDPCNGDEDEDDDDDSWVSRVVVFSVTCQRHLFLNKSCVPFIYFFTFKLLKKHLLRQSHGKSVLLQQLDQLDTQIP